MSNIKLISKIITSFFFNNINDYICIRKNLVIGPHSCVIQNLESFGRGLLMKYFLGTQNWLGLCYFYYHDIGRETTLKTGLRTIIRHYILQTL
jgi:hypothetical protein